jgi:hypothetical protein
MPLQFCRKALLIIFALLATGAAAPFALAQQTAPQQPPGLTPLPPDQLPPQMKLDPSLEPTITIKQRGADKIEEFRIRGRIYMVRVTPPHGVPYFLVDQSGEGKFAPANGPTDPLIYSVPMWVIGTF